VRRFTQAYEAGAVDEVVALLTEDAWLIMPPIPLRYQGRELAARQTITTAARPLLWPEAVALAGGRCSGRRPLLFLHIRS
jgi:hypothetical protein